MKKVKITAVRKTEYRDLMEKYENPIEHPCDVKEGDVFIANGWERPDASAFLPGKVFLLL